VPGIFPYNYSVFVTANTLLEASMSSLINNALSPNFPCRVIWA